ncbi:MAG: glycosyltransferase [Armatimonadetes bacterium]|nr:glycosyltransferase [Armatimonadota bacterium]
MNILMQNRPDARTHPGGDTVQMERTAAALRLMGLKVDISLELAPDLAGYDLVHLFNTTRARETCLHARNARRQGKPIALSTIYWTMEELQRFAPPAPWIRRIAASQALWRALDRLIPPSPLRRKLEPRLIEGRLGRRKIQEEALSSAGVWLPNAEAERAQIEKDFAVSRPAVIVPNAADPLFADARPDAFIRETGLKDFILCAARIEPRKNQVSLLQAATGMGRPVVLMGRVQLESYGQACRAVSGVETIHIPEAPPEKVASAMAAAAVHALPSWYETPGLASLEAALSGSPVVTTDRGTAREYFGNMAFYCDPARVETIRSALLDALASPPGPALQEHIARRFTWEAAAKATLEGYRLLLAK